MDPDKLFGKNSQLAQMATTAQRTNKQPMWVARQQPRKGLVPPGVAGAAWLEFLARQGALEAREGCVPLAWADELVDWLHGFAGMTSDVRKVKDHLKLVKRVIRVAKKNESFRNALGSTLELGGQSALVEFVQGYDFTNERPW